MTETRFTPSFRFPSRFASTRAGAKAERPGRRRGVPALGWLLVSVCAACTPQGMKSSSGPQPLPANGADRASAVAPAGPSQPAARAGDIPPGVDVAGPTYSPFVVHVQGEVPYRRVSFKQVGPPLASVDRTLLFESIAESLALELGRTEQRLTSETRFTPEVQDPANHLACGSAHIYVDFWNEGSQSHPVYGFSMWSGCGEESLFAKDAVEAPSEADLPDQVLPLARRIAERLDHAAKTSCFRRSC